MVQLNLLPDVKLEFIKTQRIKRLVLSVSFIVIAASIGAFVLMFSFVKGAQGRHITNLNKDTESLISDINDRPGVNEILTIQNQLNVVSQKHAEKPATSRILPFIAQMLPAGAKIKQVTVNFDEGSMTISGNTANINDINKFVDTIKFAQYKSGESIVGRSFSEVVLQSYSAGKDGGESDFAVGLKFDTAIFDNKQEISIVVPGIVSTRSDTEKPNIEFTPDNSSQEGAN
ncbi:hypothetical protein KDA00_00360 [Candidatus Saccharibacteria bacterium]|nr:hypothetical protein [Candidatus Saccharibacteria bacterium]